MFTGIIEEIGKVERIQKDSRNCKLSIKASKILTDIHLGDSIAVNGICLTVTYFNHQSFTVDVMNETWSRTALTLLKHGSEVNLERALSVNGRLGGHVVTGHIDGTGKISSIKKDDNAVWYQINTQKEILDLIVEKGSITIDGISLTVAKVSKVNFSVSVIPHTLEQTILKSKQVGSTVNLENDILGKYVQKLMDNSPKSEISKELLYQNGF
ncbi:TPA: riboflavin synthase [Streptococcus pneumoniae]|nr:riboflavin synthase [Streptococcus pneumoniae]HET5672432.1 riboflavin synthase [Streptococcus pneumoniae]HET8423901.1 riboflavin synthase [Streptococcus pneumoniae]HET8441931.1 riboflavin synthase [Streptococcus pneumoniae]